MDDLIRRKAAIDALKKQMSDWNDDYNVPVRKSIENIERLPSAQPEIIRCKDCKYCDRGIDENGNPFLKCLGWSYGGTQDEDFCSHAERRTDDGI